MLKEFTVNDTCYQCHPEKRGPLLFEHEPVRESCLNCHKPHGSTQAKLLYERPPYLCQDCHNMGSHQAVPLSGAILPGGSASVGQGTLGPGNTLITNPRLLARGCLNCHSNIHGSNSPGGQYFTR
jgi:DmsE family decaheme c-type cytochrome